VFDDQDSGNICFSVENSKERLFIKFAGAETLRYEGASEDAVQRLKSTVPIYQKLRHRTLISFLGAEAVGSGFALIFRWTDAVCMGRMYPEARERFLTLPLEKKQRIFRDVLDFLEYTASQGYAAVDFYDGSILYDFRREETVICDIDFFRMSPFVNDMGRMWGSSLFMSPEEFALDARIDEVTNVYTAGAVAFALLAEFRREEEHWPLSTASWQVAARAVSPERELRQQSIREFIAEWEASL
jgi:serine/threonine-protein kinase